MSTSRSFLPENPSPTTLAATPPASPRHHLECATVGRNLSNYSRIPHRSGVQKKRTWLLEEGLPRPGQWPHLARGVNSMCVSWYVAHAPASTLLEPRATVPWVSTRGMVMVVVVRLVGAKEVIGVAFSFAQRALRPKSMLYAQGTRSTSQASNFRMRLARRRLRDRSWGGIS